MFARPRVDRRAYDYARHWARLNHRAMPDGTAEDQLEGYLNTAMMKVMADDKWQCPPEIEALCPPPRPAPASDLDDHISF